MKQIKKQSKKPRLSKKRGASATARTGGPRLLRPTHQIRSIRQGLASTSLSECAVKYMSSLINPFNDGPAEVCIPDDATQPSQKVKVWARGIFYTSTTNGLGSISMIGALCNTNSLGWTSGATSNQPGVVTSGQTGSVQVLGNHPYANVAGTNIRARLVSMGLRIRYAGVNDGLGGTVVGFVHPSHSTVAGMTTANMLAYPDAVKYPCQRQWVTMVYSPVVDAETDYSATDANPNVAFGAFLISAPNLTSIPYDYEIFQNLEYVGTVVGSSPSISDSVGFSATRNIVNKIDNTYAGDPKPVVSSAVKMLATSVAGMSGGPFAGAASQAVMSAMGM